MELTSDDLDACLDVVNSYWTQIQEYTSRSKLTSDDLETLFHYFEQLVEIVALDLANDQDKTRVLARLEKEHIFNEYFTWLLKTSDSTGRLKEHLLTALLPLCRSVNMLSKILTDRNLCRFAVSAIDYVITVGKHSHSHQQHPHPQQQQQQDQINQLLGQVVLSISKAIASKQDLFLAVYSNRCAFLPAYSTFLSQQSKTGDNEERFPIISAMLSVALISGEAGNLGRQAIILLVDAVRQHERIDIAIFLAENTDLCPVLATGLSGLFSTLPRNLEPDSNSVLFDHEKFDQFFNKSEHVLFVECFRFVNRVVTLSHSAIRDRLVDFLYHGFLVPVLAPALNQPLGDALVTTIVYLDYLCLQNLSDCHVAGAFAKFLLSASYDGISTIDTLINYLILPAKVNFHRKSGSLASVSTHWKLLFCTIGMFHSFLSLRSFPGAEDVFHELIHRYLSNLTYLMRSQRLQLVAQTKQRLKSMCILCSLAPHKLSNGSTGDHLYQTDDPLPNAFYKRGADHFITLVTLDTPARDSDDSLPPSPTESQPTPAQKHLFSVAVIRSLEDSPVGRQLLSEYTAMLEEAPPRLTHVYKQTKNWRKCGTINSVLVGLCPVHRQLVMEQREDEKFFDAEIWTDFDGVNESSELTLDEAEDEINRLVEALSDGKLKNDEDSGMIEDSLESLDMADLSKWIPTSVSELPFEMNVTGIGHGRQHSDSLPLTPVSASKITVGPFLTRIFELVDHFLELPAPVIIALGALLSYLASIPHPLLGPLLLDPLLNVHPNVKSLPLVLSAVRERLLEKIQSSGYSSVQLRETMSLQCQQLSSGHGQFAEQMRHWSPSTSPLPTDENHFSSPQPLGSRFNALRKSSQEPPNSPRSFFSRLLLSSNRSNNNDARNEAHSSANSGNNNNNLRLRTMMSPQRKNSTPPSSLSNTPTSVRRNSLASQNGHSHKQTSMSASSSSEFENTPLGSQSKIVGGVNIDRLSLFARSIVLFDITLLELAATSNAASRRCL